MLAKTKRLNSSREGIILFAHGSRTPAWRKPFERLLKDVKKRSGRDAVLAFGEFMTPTLVDAARMLAKKGVTRAVVVPLFLGGGAHVRSDAPRLAQEAAQASGLKLKVVRAAGEDAHVLRAMADYAIAAGSKKVATKPATSARRKLS